MAELEEQLSAILDNPEAMGQIMSLARSLSGGGKKEEKTAGPTLRPEPPREESQEDPPDLSSLLGQVDPGMLQMGMRLFREYQGKDDRNAALLAALRPFLKEDRRAKLDRALELVRMLRLIRAALGAVGGKGDDGDV